MRKSLFLWIFIFFFFLPISGNSQINESQTGAWYMYFFNTTFKESSWGFQGDIQYRNLNLIGDLEQLLFRGGISYQPKQTQIKLTLGYGNITNGSSTSINSINLENRIYQELMFPIKFSNRIQTNHRFRSEQRFIEGQDLRTRYRYNLFINIPLNKTSFKSKTLYLSIYDELFINGELNTGDDEKVNFFDRNRLYTALGYMINNQVKLQLGFMSQRTSNWNRTQLQLSFHHNIQYCTKKMNNIKPNSSQSIPTSSIRQK